MRFHSTRIVRATLLALSAAATSVALGACSQPPLVSRTGATATVSPSATSTPAATPSPPPRPAETATPTPNATVAAARATAAAGASAPAVQPAVAAAPVRGGTAFDAAGMPLNTKGEAPRRPTVNAASAGFPAPPAKATSSPPNAGGISRIVSAALGLDHYIDVLGIVDNQMESPDHDGSYAVGWYSTLGTPGVPGNAVFSAHETWAHMQGPFYFMNTANLGDSLSLVMTDGRRLTYEVIRMGRYTVDTIPMGELIWPPNRPAHEQWLTLITCGGAIVYHGEYGDYVDRDIVILRRVS